MQEQLDTLLKEARKKIENVSDIRQLDDVRVEYLGKHGVITESLKSLHTLSKEERPEVGQRVNQIKQTLAILIYEKKESLETALLNEKLKSEVIDVTMPGRISQVGNLHPVTKMRYRAEALFKNMGFSVVEGPEIEDDYYNFTALNIPEHHPARAMHDTFYFSDGYLLRTHTSPVQIRVMENSTPPLQIITPGRVYRCDSDQTHSPMFHQLEGLCVSEACSFSHLKAVIINFLTQFFDKKLELRFRPSYFPFTEPSAEVDIRDGDGWLEVLGCGMVHPNVLKNTGIDSDKYSGFAFGIGLDRLAMLYYKINDLRLFFENDLKFLRQF